jgi:hypothetical protein
MSSQKGKNSNKKTTAPAEPAAAGTLLPQLCNAWLSGGSCPNEKTSCGRLHSVATIAGVDPVTRKVTEATSFDSNKHSQLCGGWLREHGCGRPGSECTFAHGLANLLPRADKRHVTTTKHRRLTLCSTWLLEGGCPDPEGCCFAVGLDRITLHEGEVSTSFCTEWFITGDCNRGPACPSNHFRIRKISGPASNKREAAIAVPRKSDSNVAFRRPPPPPSPPMMGTRPVITGFPAPKSPPPPQQPDLSSESFAIHEMKKSVMDTSFFWSCSRIYNIIDMLTGSEPKLFREVLVTIKPVFECPMDTTAGLSSVLTLCRKSLERFIKEGADTNAWEKYERDLALIELSISHYTVSSAKRRAGSPGWGELHDLYFAILKTIQLCHLIGPQKQK